MVQNHITPPSIYLISWLVGLSILILVILIVIFSTTSHQLNQPNPLPFTPNNEIISFALNTFVCCFFFSFIQIINVEIWIINIFYLYSYREYFRTSGKYHIWVLIKNKIKKKQKQKFGICLWFNFFFIHICWYSVR